MNEDISQNLKDYCKKLILYTHYDSKNKYVYPKISEANLDKL